MWGIRESRSQIAIGGQPREFWSRVLYQIAEGAYGRRARGRAGERGGGGGEGRGGKGSKGVEGGGTWGSLRNPGIQAFPPPWPLLCMYPRICLGTTPLATGPTGDWDLRATADMRKSACSARGTSATRATPCRPRPTARSGRPCEWCGWLDRPEIAADQRPPSPQQARTQGFRNIHEMLADIILPSGASRVALAHNNSIR